MPSAYIGLDRLMVSKTWKPKSPEIHSVPLNVVQVSREDPYLIMPDDRPHKWTNLGVVFPDARHIIVNEKVLLLLKNYQNLLYPYPC